MGSQTAAQACVAKGVLTALSDTAAPVPPLPGILQALRSSGCANADCACVQGQVTGADRTLAQHKGDARSVLSIGACTSAMCGA